MRRTRAHRLDAVAEAAAVLEARVGQGLVHAHVLAGARRQPVHLRLALGLRQLLPEVLHAVRTSAHLTCRGRCRLRDSHTPLRSRHTLSVTHGL